MQFDLRKKILQVQNILRKEYKEDKTLLNYKNAWELLIAVSLSAQTTDEQVNRATTPLFARWSSPSALAEAKLEDIEQVIHGTGFYHNKAKNIRNASCYLVQEHGGEVPSTMDELVKVPGIGRKSAGVVLHHIFNKPAIIVDTHFGRVCSRLGLLSCDPAEKKPDPIRTEQEIASILDSNLWSSYSMLANIHGRRYCISRKPLCSSCPLKKICDYFQTYVDASDSRSQIHQFGEIPGDSANDAVGT